MPEYSQAGSSGIFSSSPLADEDKNASPRLGDLEHLSGNSSRRPELRMFDDHDAHAVHKYIRI